MGVLVRKDTLLFRKQFEEMCKLRGISCAYQWVTKKEFTVHSEQNFEFSAPVRMNIILDENPSIETLNTYGWLSELNETTPIIAHLPWNTYKLMVGCRITLATVKGTDRPRIFEVTKIASNLEYPDSYAVALAPVLDQFPQRNQYTLVNDEKLNNKESEYTSKEQHTTYVTKSEEVDTTPKKQIEYENSFDFISLDNSPYSAD